MNNSLLKSVIALVLFYGAAAVIWLWMLPPKDLLALLHQIPEFMRIEKVPELKGLHFLNLEPVQKLFFAAWSFQVLKGWLISAAIGILITVASIFLFLRHRKLRKRASGAWRTLGVTIGPLPVPSELKRSRMEVRLKGIKLSKDERLLLEEILGTLKAHPDAYVGAGHGAVTLYEHTMSVVEKVMDLPEFAADHVLCAAAHDMGKITSFIKGPDGSWERTKMHAQESGRILATLPAWGRLPEAQREAIRLAVKNEHSPNMVPGIDSAIPVGDIDPTVRKSLSSDFRHPLYDRQEFRRRVINLIDALRAADGMVTAAEKKVVLSEIDDLPGFCLAAFLKALPAMPFYYTGVPPGTKGMVWQQGKRLYISEAKMRDHVMAEALSDEHHAALGGTYRGPKTIAPFTWNLLEAFKQKGWLVTKAKCYEKFHKNDDPEPGPQPVEMECRADMPLWDVLSGNKVLNGMIIIDVTDDDVLARTPQKKLGFAIGPHKPHQPAPGGYRPKEKSGVKLMTQEELRGEGEKNKAQSPKKKTEPKLEAPAATPAETAKPKEAAPAPPPEGGALPDAALSELLAEKKPKAPTEPVKVAESAPDPQQPPRPADLVASEDQGSSVEPAPPSETPPPAPEAPKVESKPKVDSRQKNGNGQKPAHPAPQQGGNGQAKPKQKAKAKPGGGGDSDSGKVDYFNDLLQ